MDFYVGFSDMKNTPPTRGRLPVMLVTMKTSRGVRGGGELQSQ